MKKRSLGSIEWLEFDLLLKYPNLVHGSFCRNGGVSKEAFASLNVSVSVGDVEKAVFQNRQLISHILGDLPLEALNQVHGSTILCLDHPFPEDRKADGLITKSLEVGLLIQHADCQAALFYDPVNQVIGNVHAGWRGNVQNIYQEMVSRMACEYGSRPSDLIVCISPSLGPQAAEFKNYRQEFPEHFWKFNVGNFYFNLWEIARMQLKKAGVLEKHIEIAEVCTYSHPESWFSYRKNRVCGRNATVIGLRSS